MSSTGGSDQHKTLAPSGSEQANGNEYERTDNVSDEKNEDSDATDESPKSPRDEMSERKLFLLVTFFRLLIPVGALFCVVYLIILFSNPDNWETDPDVGDVPTRISNRGTVVSLLGSILLNCVGVCSIFCT